MGRTVIRGMGSAVAVTVLLALGAPAGARADLVLTLSDPPVPAIAGDTAQITATVKNTGGAPEDDVTVVLQSQDEGIDAPTLNGCSTFGPDSPFVFCQFFTVGAGQTVSAPVTYGPLRAGTATVAGSVSGGSGAPLNWTTAVAAKAKLGFELSAQPQSLTVGNTTTVSAKVTNSGAGKAYGAALRLSLPPGLTVTSLPAGCARTGLSLTCDLGAIPSLGVETRAIPLSAPQEGSFTVLGAASWARDTAVPADLSIGVSAPIEPDSGPGSPTAPAATGPRTVAISRVAIGLPSSRRCLRERLIDVLLRRFGGAEPKSAVVTVAGRVRRLSGARARAPFVLRIPRSGRFTIRLAVTFADGSRLNASRRYRACVPRRGASRR